METLKTSYYLLTLTTLSLLTLSILTTQAQAQAQAQLSPTFYARSCPQALTTIRDIVNRAIAGEARMAASLIRLHFHDCFVQGCDASILLDDAPNIQSEKSAGPNANSARGFDVIEAAKSAIERLCPKVVSCADILAVAARDASVIAGGPSWNVRLGRRDSNTANFNAANTDLPGPSSTLQGLTSAFAKKGLSQREMVVLSGSHSIGRAQCVFFRARIYSNDSIDPTFAATMRRNCPQTGGDSNLAPLDSGTPDSLDNNYYRNLVAQKGLFKSDQVLFSNGSTMALVSNYSTNPALFRLDYASAMLKMSEIGALLGSRGIIRTVCNATN